MVGPVAQAWRRYHIGLSLAWRTWCTGVSVEEDLTEPSAKQQAVPRPQAAGEPLVLRWQCHWRLAAGGRELCVRCGLGPRTIRRPDLGDTPCGGNVPLRAAAIISLRHGLFKRALDDAPELWRAKVAASSLRVAR